jgi:hypothetical protein
MNARTVAALVIAPITCGLVFGAWLLWGLDRSESHGRPHLFVLFLPGMMYGALFEVLVLLPLSVVLRRLGRSTNGPLVVCGIVCWIAAVLLNTLATSELQLSQFGLREISAVFLPLIFPGVALVLVFVFIAQGGKAA